MIATTAERIESQFYVKHRPDGSPFVAADEAILSAIESWTVTEESAEDAA